MISLCNIRKEDRVFAARTYMKKFVAILMLALTLTALMLPVYADTPTNADVYYGTPEIDGKLDDMYLNSYYSGLDTCFGAWNNAEDADTAEELDPKAMPQVKARSYLLYDEHYLYICTVVTDETIMSIGESALLLDPSEFQTDSVEMWINDNGYRFKVNIDAYGYHCYCGDGIPTIKEDEVIYVTTVDEANGQYIVEAALPIKEIGPGKNLGYSLQVNNMVSEYTGNYNSSLISCDYAPLDFINVSAATGETVDVVVITTEETTRRQRETRETAATSARETTEKKDTEKSTTPATSASSSLIQKKDNTSSSNAWIWIVVAVVVVAVAAVVVIVVAKKKKK